MGDDEQILTDIGRKCGDDVSAAIHRNLQLARDQREAMVIASYSAATAIGAANGAYAAYMGGTEHIDEALVDQLWSTILRPMILGEIRPVQS